MKTAGDIIERYIKKYHDLVDYINDCTDKRIPISQKDDELRNDLSRFWMAAAGNPNSRDGSWEHGKPIIYDAMEEYASQKEHSEAKERYERATKFLSQETYMNGEFNRVDIALKLASGLTDKQYKA